MVDMDYITLENGKEYAIVYEINVVGNRIVYLVCENEVELRKLDEKEDLLKIEDNELKDKAMLEFMKKHRNDFTN